MGKLTYLPIWILIGWLMLSLVVYLSIISKPPTILEFSSADKLEHLVAYSILMGWFTQIYTSRNKRIFMAIQFCLLGISLEILQGWGGHRFFEYMDMLANTAGVFLGWWISSKVCAGWLARFDQFLSRQD